MIIVICGEERTSSKDDDDDEGRKILKLDAVVTLRGCWV